MKIPKRKKAQFTVNLPISKKRVTVTPFDVSDELILAQAAEADDINANIEALLQVVSGCVQDDIDVSDLPTVDLEYLFLNIRAKSVGEKIELKYKFPDGVEVPVEIPIDKIKVDLGSCKNNKIKIDEDTMVVMRPPSYSIVREFIANETEEGDKFAVLRQTATCVSQLVIGEDVYQEKDLEVEDVAEWLSSLTLLEYVKVSDYVANLPVLTYTAKIIHPETNEVVMYDLRGLQDFF